MWFWWRPFWMCHKTRLRGGKNWTPIFLAYLTPNKVKKTIKSILARTFNFRHISDIPHQTNCETTRLWALWFFIHYCDFWIVTDWTNVDPMLFSCWTNVIASGPAWSINMLWHLPSLYPANTRRWNNIGLILSQHCWQWTNVSQH